MSLQGLPEETVQHIALYLEDDKDLVHFRASCQNVRCAIDARPAHFWMYRYQQYYDMPRKPCSLDLLKDMYQTRKSVLRSLPNFKGGKEEEEAEILRYLLDLALDASPTSLNEYGVPTSKNFEVIEHVIKTSNILLCIFQRNKASTPTKGLQPMHHKNQKVQRVLTLNRPSSLEIFQLLLSARALSFVHQAPLIFSFEFSQQMAYMDAHREPIFGGATGMEVNIPWALHVVNFFRYHMLRDVEATLCPAFRDLSQVMEGTDMPQLWNKKLNNDAGDLALGKTWKGSYAYLSRNDINKIRKDLDPTKNVYPDHNVDNGAKAIQTMDLSFPEKKDLAKTKIWDPVFEFHLSGEGFHANIAAQMAKGGQRPVTRGAKAVTIVGPERPEELKSVYFNGNGWDDEEFQGAGYISQLPSQATVPGWKRMVMMKYFIEAGGLIDYDALWAYEGVVLPGDQIIVGRWWSPDPDRDLRRMYSGPFILWNTDCGSNYRAINEARSRSEDAQQAYQDLVSLTHG